MFSQRVTARKGGRSGTPSPTRSGAGRSRWSPTLTDALAATAAFGYPVAVKTDEPGIAHKSDVGGVRLRITSEAGLAAAYTDLAARLGPRATVREMAAPAPELIIGMARDQALGPLIVTGPGGLIASYSPERTVALPPLHPAAAAGMISRLRFAEVLAGVRGSPPSDLAAVVSALVCFAALVSELGGPLEPSTSTRCSAARPASSRSTR